MKILILTLSKKCKDGSLFYSLKNGLYNGRLVAYDMPFNYLFHTDLCVLKPFNI